VSACTVGLIAQSRYRPLVAQVIAERSEEPVRSRDDPVMAAPALHHGQPPAGNLHILDPHPRTSRRYSPASSIAST
jgi:hypothetical protein